MMNESDYWKTYGKYIELITPATERVSEWMNKNPQATPTEYLKKMEFLQTLEHLCDVFTKQYHLMVMMSRNHGDFIAEKQRLMRTAATNEYHLRQRLEALTKENETLKSEIKILMEVR